MNDPLEELSRAASDANSAMQQEQALARIVTNAAMCARIAYHTLRATEGNPLLTLPADYEGELLCEAFQAAWDYWQDVEDGGE